MYGILIWDNASKTLLIPIHILQKKFVRMATFNDGYPIVPGPLAHTPPLFHNLRLLTIYEIFKLQLGKLIYESVNNLGLTKNVIKFTDISEIHYQYTRYASHGNLYTNNVRSTRYGLKCLQNEAKELWATIPTKIKYTITLGTFKSIFKRYMIEAYVT